MKFKLEIPIHQEAQFSEINDVMQQIETIGEIAEDCAPLVRNVITGYVTTEDSPGVIDCITIWVDCEDESKAFMHGYNLAQKEIEINDYLRSLGWETAETPFKVVED